MSEAALSPERVRALAERGEVQLVDVRTEEERDAAHVPGSRHIPLDRVEEAAGELERDQPVIFYCRSGDRSSMAAEAFRASGWDSHNMEGGILAWSEGGLPLEPEGGEIISPSGLPPK